MRKMCMAVITLLVFQVQSVLADFNVVPVIPNVGVKINALPKTISEPGFYYLGRDLQTDSDGIIIDADNVTLDLMGHTITGAGKASGNNKSGISIAGYSNVEVRNGTITEFASRGVSATSGESNRFVNLRIRQNGGIGIYTTGPDHLISNCHVAHNGGSGINSTAQGEYDGFIARDNQVMSNGAHGIYTSNYNAVISGNTAAFNGTDGIHTNGAATISNNTAYQNTANGIYSGYGCSIIGNAARENGVGIYAGEGSVIKNNAVYGNTTSGIEANEVSLIQSNAVYGNGTDMVTNGGSPVFLENASQTAIAAPQRTRAASAPQAESR